VTNCRRLIFAESKNQGEALCQLAKDNQTARRTEEIFEHWVKHQNWNKVSGFLTAHSALGTSLYADDAIGEISTAHPHVRVCKGDMSYVVPADGINDHAEDNCRMLLVKQGTSTEFCSRIRK
jgi:hypothetical protein